VKVQAIWRGKGKDDAGRPCKCSCCEARQFVSTTVTSETPGLQRTGLKTDDLIGPLFERADPDDDYATSKDSEWFKVFLKVPMQVKRFNKKTGKFEATQGAGAVTQDLLFRPKAKPGQKRDPGKNPFAINHDKLLRRAAHNNAPGTRAVLSKIIERFGVHGQLSTKVRQTKDGLCIAEWLDHTQGPPPAKPKGSTSETAMTLTVVIRPKACGGTKYEEECALGMYSERLEDKGKCKVSVSMC
jgi:hypothetical protein